MSTYRVEPDELRASATDLRSAAGLDAAASDAEAADAASRAFQDWLRKFLGGGS